MIELNHVHRRFGDILAVRDLSFAVRRGEVLGFLGPNGAGKSTTMRLIAGVLVPDAGEVRLDGVSVQSAPLRAATRLGFLPEGAPAWPDMTVEQFLHFIARVRKLSGAAASRALARVRDLTHLQAVWGQRIDTLSKGYQRRVGLAQAILHEPPALIMDEPTDGLDPNQKHDIRAAIVNMAQATAIIISTHILEEVEAVCTRAIIIDKGRLLCDESPAALAARSRYVGAVRLTLSHADASTIAQPLEALAGVEAVQTVPQGAHRVLSLLPKTGHRTLLEEVAASCQQHGCTPVNLALESGRLDDVFRQLTMGEPETVETSAAPKPETPPAADTESLTKSPAADANAADSGAADSGTPPKPAAPPS